MDETKWKRVWRALLRARFGSALKGKRLEEAVARAETFRRMAAAVSAVKLDNGELPFSNALTPPAEAGRP